MYLKLILEMVKEQNKTKDEAQDESLNICYLEKQGITSPTSNKKEPQLRNQHESSFI